MKQPFYRFVSSPPFRVQHMDRIIPLEKFRLNLRADFVKYQKYHLNIVEGLGSFDYLLKFRTPNGARRRIGCGVNKIFWKNNEAINLNRYP